MTTARPPLRDSCCQGDDDGSGCNCVPKNNAPREYFDSVDFTSEYDNWGMRGGFMLFVPKHLTVSVVNAIIEKGGENFFLSLDPCFGMWSNRTVRIECRTQIAEHIEAHLEDMLVALHAICGKIIYREGLHGYSITPQGKILEKWETDDGMS